MPAVFKLLDQARDLAIERIEFLARLRDVDSVVDATHL